MELDNQRPQENPIVRLTIVTTPEAAAYATTVLENVVLSLEHDAASKRQTEGYRADAARRASQLRSVLAYFVAAVSL